MATNLEAGPTAAVIEGGNVEVPPADSRPWPSSRLAWYSLVLLTAATGMNFFDAGVAGMMVEFIKHDFVLSDWSLSLLMGPAGILFYVFVGIPLARLVDIYSRTKIVGIGLIVTSGMTAVSGLAQSFGQFFFSRAFTGVGGSAHAPGSYSLISDLFPPIRLPRAFGVLQFGFIFGAVGAPLIGGWALKHMGSWAPTQVGPLLIHGWQWLLIFIGIPGLVIAALILALPEPARRGKVSGARALPLRAVLAEIWARRGVYIPLFVGLALTSLDAGGLQFWRVPLMLRSYHWDMLQIGIWGSATAAIAFPLGAFLGTVLTEQLSKRYKDAPVRTTVTVFAICLPFSVLSPLMPSGELSTVLAGVSGVFAFAAAVPQNIAIQTITPNEMRGQVTAIYLFMFTVFGALGSSAVALVTEHIAGGEQNLWFSMSLAAGVLLPFAVIVIALAMKPYAREIERLESLKTA